MKILVIASLYYPAVGGTENYLKEITKHLAQKGNEVHVFTAAATSWRTFQNPFSKELEILEEVVDGVKIKRFKSRRWISFLSGSISALFWTLGLPFSDYLRTFQNGPILIGLENEIKKLKPDLILASAFPAYSILQGAAAAEKQGIPFILIPALHPQDRWSYDRKIFFKTAKKTRHIITHTEFEREYLIKKGISPEKITAVGVGVNIERLKNGRPLFRQKLGIPQNNLFLLYIGHKTPHKGAETLIKAMPLIWKENQNITLVLAGAKDPFSDKIKKLTEKHASNNKIIDLNFFESRDKADLISSCDIFALPSTAESFGIVYLEAWACKKPVIGCMGGAPATIIDHETDGLLVKPKDEKSLAAAVLKLAFDPNLREKMGQNGYNKVKQKYTWNIINRKLEEVFLACIRSV